MWRFNAPGKRHDAIVRDKITLGSLLGVVVVGTAVIGAFTGGWLDAVWLPVKLFVVPFLLFAHIIGWTVYVHHVSPEIRWWTRREWTQFKGQMESTTVLRMPRLANRLWFHNIFVHVPHHVDARIRFDKLPKAVKAIAAAYPKTVHSSRISIRRYVRTTRACKLYDFEAGRWLSYSAART
jgi:omega-6 fatty acid desaturase (delta-12 desaturase)